MSIITPHRHHVAVQFCPFPQIRNTMIRWRNENQPATPKHLWEIAPILRVDLWETRLAYDVTVAAKPTGGTEKTTHQLEAIQVRDDDGAVHVVFGTKSYAESFQDIPNMLVDATFDVVPNINGGYQLLTVMGEKGGQVHVIDVSPVEGAKYCNRALYNSANF